MTNPLYDQLFGSHIGKGSPLLRLADGSVVTYAAFLGLAAQMAHVLTQGGLRPGDRLAAQVQKSPEALALYAACVQAGVVFLPLNTAYTTDELRYFVEDSGARMIVCDAKAELALSSVAMRAGASLETLNADGSGTLTDSARVMPEAFPTVARSADDLAALLYTSGTTGRSKGAMLSQGNLLTNAVTLAREWRFTSADDLATVKSIAYEVVVMQHGVVVERGPKAELFANPKEAYTNLLLLSSVPDMDPDWLNRMLAERSGNQQRG